MMRPEPGCQLAIRLPQGALLLSRVHEEHQVLGAERADGRGVLERSDDRRVHPQRVLDDVLALPVSLVGVLELCAADAAGRMGVVGGEGVR